MTSWNSSAGARTRLFSGLELLFDREGVTMATGNQEHHRTDRIGWLRAAVLGANDGTWLGGEVGGGFTPPSVLILP
jgi:hypothetical protein